MIQSLIARNALSRVKTSKINEKWDIEQETISRCGVFGFGMRNIMGLTEKRICGKYRFVRW